MADSKELVTLQKKVERYLKAGISKYEIHGERYLVRTGSAMVVVHPFDWTEGKTLVRLLVPVLEHVEKAGNEAMFEEFSKMNDVLVFGKIYWSPQKDSQTVGTILMEYVHLGEFLDEEELLSSLTSLALAADSIDDDLKAKYGGERWTDPPSRSQIKVEQPE